MEALVETKNLRTHFPILKGLLRRQTGAVQAVDGISLRITEGKWMGLVGESGCGKTTLGKTILRLLTPTSGQIFFDVRDDQKDRMAELESSGDNKKQFLELRYKYDLATFTGSRLKAMRKEMQLVHQDPYTSLNPRMKIKNVIAEPIKVHNLLRGSDLKDRVIDLLIKVGLSDRYLPRYPHQFSGGQRQRIAIARALATNPRFIIFDEPTSALDVSVQAQILTLLQDLRVDQNLTYLYITHDLSVAESVCDHIAVMYLGKIVEMGTPLQIFRSPKHPYTQALVLSTPLPDPKRKRGRIVLKGEVPSPSNPPSGCRFHPRCSRATEECEHTEPILEAESRAHHIACWHPL